MATNRLPIRPRSRHGLVPAAACAVALLGFAAAAHADDGERAGQPLAQVVTEPLSPLGAAMQRQLSDEDVRASLSHRWIDAETLAAFYEETAYAPIWTGSEAATARAAGVLEVLREAERQGLDLAAYDYPMLVARLGAAGAEEQAAFELMMSAAYVAYYGDLGEGMVSPKALYPEEYGYAPAVNARGVLHVAAASSDAAAWLQLQEPNNRLYNALLQALATYRALQAQGGWSALPDGPALEPGERHEQIPLLRARLLASGDLPSTPEITSVSLGQAPEPELYDPTLERAVRAFQLRHGLLDDGVLGPRTRAALNVPVEERLQQILINLERVRWMPGYLGDRYILANTAGFSVDVVEDGRTVLSMAAIVGEDERQTPVFSDVMQLLEFNPYWNIPPSIAAEEIGPKVLADGGYLGRQKIRVLDGYQDGAREFDPADVDWSNLGEDSPYRLRQDPGPLNPLGDVKFMFPNRYAVYLHDTPGDQLFEKTQRAFSHGCIRVSKPLELATYLLQGQDGWTAQKIAAVMATDERRTVDLDRTIPVHIAYLTAWVDDEGRMQFRDDIYGRDGALSDALQKAQANLPRAPRTAPDL